MRTVMDQPWLIAAIVALVAGVALLLAWRPLRRFGRQVNRRDTFRAETFHLLRVVNQGTERADRPAVFLKRVLNHLDRALDAKTKSVFVG